MNLSLIVQVLNAQQQLTADDGNMCFAKVGRFELLFLLVEGDATVGVCGTHQIQARSTTKVLHDNP